MPQSTIPSQPDAIGFTDDELANLARRHRAVIVAWFAASLILILIFLTGSRLTRAAGGIVPWNTTRQVVLVGSHALLVMRVARLRLAVGDGWFMGCFIAVWCGLPYLNLAIVPICLLDAVQILRAAFGRLPPWGFSAAALAARQGCCRECGYDLHGLKGTACPECGATFDPVPATDPTP